MAPGVVNLASSRNFSLKSWTICTIQGQRLSRRETSHPWPVYVKGSPTLASSAMELITILNRCHHFRDSFLSRVPFSRDWFFEQRNGNCRLMAKFAVTLSETAPMWRRSVAPTVEWLARTLWEESPKMTGHRPPASRLTQNRKRGAQGGIPALPSVRPAPR